MLNLAGDAPKRADYLRRKGLFGLMGTDVSYSPRKIPLYPKLIRIHNNVSIASGVQFLTHDISDNVVNGYLKVQGRPETVSEKLGCIEIMDNVFLGADTTVLYDVKIGENCIIGAKSLVNRDIPPNSVAAGVPCRVIGSFEDFVQKRLSEESERMPSAVRGVEISDEAAAACWQAFERKREGKA